MTIKWRPCRNTERNALRRSPEWFEIRREAGRILISDTSNWRIGDLRWINETQMSHGDQQ